MKDNTSILYAHVILPLAIPKEYSYIVPAELEADVAFGFRVEVPLRNKLYAGLVVGLEKNISLEYKARHIISVIDDKPIISVKQYQLWKWIASYYCCHIGEVMNVALPSGMKLTSETKIYINPNFDENMQGLSDDEFLIAEALQVRGELTIDEVRSILDRKTVYPVIRKLMDLEVLLIKEELKNVYKPKTISVVRLKAEYKANPDLLSDVLEQVKRSKRQTQAVLAIYQLSRKMESIPRSEIYEMSSSDSTVLNALNKKGVIEFDEVEVSRLKDFESQENAPLPELTEDQNEALQQIEDAFDEKNQVLLFGVTGSGKTRVYIELIKKQIAQGKQVLYLLPEIALTTQIVHRLSKIFGEEMGVYHSKMGNAERVELWKAVYDEKPLIIGARSSLFLPFQNLGLIVVDEEHDPSYKQNDPAPRYQGRDTAVVMANLNKANVLFGTATPSMESYANVTQGKYTLVELRERIGNISLPEIELVDLRQQYKTGRMKAGFSQPLCQAIEASLEQGDQVMLFQNRRGYAPTLSCNACGWHSECDNCDISMTVHKHFDELRCHYCGSRKRMITICPACGTEHPSQKGMGTEKIELEISQLFPKARVARMDFDTVKTRTAYETIIHEYTSRKIDILVGTQMITKGLDFEHVGVVGILNADLTLQFPDFRSGERAFQLFTQVSGRAGRKHKQGKVIIQTFQPQHPVILETVDNNFARFFARESVERKRFLYPPYFRLIEITLKHKDPKTVLHGARHMYELIYKVLGKRVIGPSQPGVARLRGQYLQKIHIKMEKDPAILNKVKSTLLSAKAQCQNTPGIKTVRINIDVDPM